MYHSTSWEIYNLRLLSFDDTGKIYAATAAEQIIILNAMSRRGAVS